MRTPKQHVAADGSVSYKIRFRVDGRQSSVTFRGDGAYDDALELSSLIHAIGAERALAWLDEQESQQAERSMTLDAWAPRYIDALTKVTDGTREEYRRMYEREWHQLLGALPLGAITHEAVAHAVNDLSRRRADKTVRNYHGLLAAMLKGAVKAGHMAVNPCDDISLPERTSHEAVTMRLIGKKEFALLFSFVDAHYQPFVGLLAASGMRFSEALALNVGDVDVAHRTVRITKALKWDSTKSKKSVGPPKTKQAVRTLDIQSEAIALLEPLLHRPKGERLFKTKTGRDISHTRFWHDVWRPAVDASLLDPKPRIHDLRHSHASWLIAAGVPLTVIQRRLGHKSIVVTSDTYGHLSPDLKLAAVQAAELALVGVSLLDASAARPARDRTALPSYGPAGHEDG